MPPRMARRGSIALSMLDNQSLAPRLESVLSSVNPPSEDAAFQVSRGLHNTAAVSVAVATTSLRFLLCSLGGATSACDSDTSIFLASF